MEPIAQFILMPMNHWFFFAFFPSLSLVRVTSYYLGDLRGLYNMVASHIAELLR